MSPLSLLAGRPEQMKGEGVEPGDVVYTAALAECRWAGQSKHVEYLLQQMEAEGMSIVPGLRTPMFSIFGLEVATGSSCAKIRLTLVCHSICQCNARFCVNNAITKTVLSFPDTVSSATLDLLPEIRCAAFAT